MEKICDNKHWVDVHVLVFRLNPYLHDKQLVDKPPEQVMHDASQFAHVVELKKFPLVQAKQLVSPAPVHTLHFKSQLRQEPESK